MHAMFLSTDTTIHSHDHDTVCLTASPHHATHVDPTEPREALKPHTCRADAALLCGSRAGPALAVEDDGTDTEGLDTESYRLG